MRRILIGAALTLAIIAAPSVALAGVTGPAFYVNGQLYRTVNTPTDISGTGAPAHAWDVIYDFGGAQMNVATAAPGTPGYNGGRWQVHALSFETSYAATLAAHDLNGNGVIDTNAEVFAAIADDSPTGATDLGVVKNFVCPVIKLAAA